MARFGTGRLMTSGPALWAEPTNAPIKSCDLTALALPKNPQFQVGV